MKRILLIRLTALGDVLLATPLLRALRRAYPDADIDWLVSGPLLPLLSENPNLTRAIADTPGGRARLFAGGSYDLCIDLQNKPRTAWLRWRLRPRRTLVLRKRSAGQALLSLWGRELPLGGPPAVERNLRLLQRLGLRSGATAAERDLDLRVPAIGRLEVAPLFSARRRGGWPPGAEKLPIGLAPGGRWATKRWPHFPELGRRLASAGHRLLLVGGPDDAAELAALASALGPAAIGDTREFSVAGLAAAIAACGSLVTNDSGPAHIAAAVGTPAVVLFGPTSPERWAPPGRLVRVVTLALPCSPCSNHGGRQCPLGTHACLRNLPVAEVQRALPASWNGPRGTLS